MHCGQPLAAPIQAAAAAQNRKLGLFIGIGTVLAIALIGLFTAGWLQRSAQAPDNRNLQATATPPPDTLQVRATAPPASLNVEAQRPTGMPDDIRRYLEHVERIEKRKQELANEQVSQMTVMLAQMQAGAMAIQMAEAGAVDPEEAPHRQTQTTIRSLKPDWQALVDEFRSVRPPAELLPLANDYYRALNEVPAMAGDIADLLNSVASDPASALTKARNMRNTSASTIDTFFRKSDTALGEICAKYNTDKWFSIKSDVGGGASFAIPGMTP